MKNRMRQLRTCGSVRGEGHEVLAYSEAKSGMARAAEATGRDEEVSDSGVGGDIVKGGILGLRLILVPKVPGENVENYRVQRFQPADSSKLAVHSETAVIPAGIVRAFPLENHFVDVIFLGKF
jgi:hypothetical protein